MTVAKTLRQELQVSNLGLHFDEPSFFVNSQWRGLSPYTLVLYRTTLAGYAVIWLTWTIIQDVIIQHQGALWFVFFTNWVLLLVMSYWTVSALVTFHHHIIKNRHKRFSEAGERDVDFPMSVSTEPITLNTDTAECVEVRVITDVTVLTPLRMRIAWFLHETVVTCSAMLTALYWIGAYDGHLQATKLNNNAIFTILLFLDNFVTKTPVRLLHVIYPLTASTTYIIFNVLYCSYASHFPQEGAQYIYQWLDWRDPLLPATGVVVILVLLVPLLHLGWFLLYQARLWLYRRYG